MSDETKRPIAEDAFNLGPGAIPQGPPPGDGPTRALKQRLENTRLPADLKELILSELPPPEECERMYRELQEKGGLSFEQFCAELGLEVKPKP